MGNDHILEKLQEGLLREVASNLEAQEVEDFMSAPAGSAVGMLNKMRKEFVEKVLHSLNPEPIRQIESGIDLGKWIEKERKKARLTHGFIATALGETPSFVERLEKAGFPPWTIAAPTGSDLAILFRIHFSAFSELVVNTGKALLNLPNPTQEITRPERVTDISPAENLPPDVDVDNQIKDWLGAVRRNLEAKQAQQLLD
jgi:hypothetical protein